jgi:aryl-alcohol dehydrogenase-like predicted oxidoreductase
VSALGVGTNRWGGRLVDQVALEAASSAALDASTGFFHTAEVYTGGRMAVSVTAPVGISVADEFAKLGALRDQGRLSPDEFEA